MKVIYRHLAAAVTTGAVVLLLATTGCASNDAVARVRPNAVTREVVAPTGTAATTPTPTTTTTPATTTSAVARPTRRVSIETVSPPVPRRAAAAPAPAAAATTGAAPTDAVAARPVAGCHGNYRPCVPNDPVDVDCKGAPGADGPSWVSGTVRINGPDVYHLDGTDKDGRGCEGSPR